MSNKTGIVLKRDKYSAYLMTDDGEYVQVKINGRIPKVGMEYTGQIYKKQRLGVYRGAIAASIALVFLFTSYAYAYYTPVSEITIEINPSLRLSSNRWNKVIRVEALNDDGELLLNHVSVKNKNVEDALEIIVEQAKEDNFIDEDFIDQNNEVQISLKGRNVNLSEFEQKATSRDLKVQVNIAELKAKDDAKKTDKEDTNNSKRDKKDDNVNNEKDNKENSKDNTKPEKNKDGKNEKNDKTKKDKPEKNQNGEDNKNNLKDVKDSKDNQNNGNAKKGNNGSSGNNSSKNNQGNGKNNKNNNSNNKNKNNNSNNKNKNK